MAVHQNFNVGLNASDYYREQAKLVSSGTRASRELSEAWNNSRKGMSGGGRSYNPGNGSGGLAVQIQDVAVQLQSGTKLATIIAQQGSQMASVFGPQGAVIGGAIAVVAFLHTMSRGTTKLVDDSKELAKAIDASAYSFSSLAENIGKAQKNLTQLKESTDTKSGKNGMLASIGDALVGGYGVITGQGTKKDKMRDETRAQETAQAAIIRGQEYLVHLGENEVEIEKLLAEGKKKEADALKDRNDYGEELVKISGLQVDADTKDTLTNLAGQKYLYQQQKRIYDEDQKELKEKAEKQKDVNADIKKEKDLRESILDVNRTNAQKIAALTIIRDSALNGTSKDPAVLAKARLVAAESEMKIQQILKADREKMDADILRHTKEHEKAMEEQVATQKKIGELQADAIDEAERRQREVNYAKGDLINDRATEILTPAAERAKIKHDEQARKRAVRRAAEEAVDKEDLELRKNDRNGGLTSAEKRKRRDDLIRKAEDARNKNKIEAKFAPDQIAAIVKQIAELQSK